MANEMSEASRDDSYELALHLRKQQARIAELEAALAKATELLAPLAEFEIETPEEMAEFKDDFRQSQRTGTLYFNALQRLAKASGITLTDAIKAAEASNIKGDA